MKPRVFCGLYHGFFDPALHPLKRLTFGSTLSDEPIAWPRGRFYNNVDDPVTIRRLTPVDNALVLTTTRRTAWGMLREIDSPCKIKILTIRNV